MRVFHRVARQEGISIKQKNRHRFGALMAFWTVGSWMDWMKYWILTGVPTLLAGPFEPGSSRLWGVLIGAKKPASLDRVHSKAGQ